MYNEIITLIKKKVDIDSYGDPVVIEERREIFAEVKSIGQTEFYQAEAVGLKPEIKFVIADYFDYENEKTLEYAQYESDPERYHIIRTYRVDNTLEIVCSRGIENVST